MESGISRNQSRDRSERYTDWYERVVGWAQKLEIATLDKSFLYHTAEILSRSTGSKGGRHVSPAWESGAHVYVMATASAPPRAHAPVTLEELNAVPVHRGVTIPRMQATLEGRNATQRGLKSRDQYIFALKRVLSGSDSAVAASGASGLCPGVVVGNEAAKSCVRADPAGATGSSITAAVTPVTQTQTNKRVAVTQQPSSPKFHSVSNRLLGPTCGGTASDADRRATMDREDDPLWSLKGSIAHCNHVGHNSTHAPLKITGEGPRKRRALADQNGRDGAGGGAQATPLARHVATRVTPRDAMTQGRIHLSMESTRLNRANAHDRQIHGPRVDLTLLMWVDGKCTWLSTRSFSDPLAQCDARMMLASLGTGEANVLAVDVTGRAAVSSRPRVWWR